MKLSASVLLLATSALANQFDVRGYDYNDGGDDKYVEKHVTYTTVTTCPVTSTYTRQGS